jgi:hypothetical protein
MNGQFVKPDEGISYVAVTDNGQKYFLFRDVVEMGRRPDRRRAEAEVRHMADVLQVF